MAFIHFDDSLALLDTATIELKNTKTLPLMHAFGYVLAKDIVASHNAPEYPTSAMDGYAIRFDDQKQGRLNIASMTPAGSEVAGEISQGLCIKTFTGSLMPSGADTLIPIENVTANGDEIVINKEVPYGFSVREVGENYAKGEVLIEKGVTIDFAQIGVLASLNCVEVVVYEKPHVAILSTGSELLMLGEEQTSPAQIRSSNNYTLEALVRKYGGVPQQLGCIADSKENIQQAMQNALEQSDIVVTTGGVSVGDFDFVKDVVEALGATLIFKGVRVKPGQHILVAQVGSKFIVGLPGFAYSATVTALLYLVPLIQKLQHSSFQLQKLQAILKEPFEKRAKKAEFTACHVSLENGVYHASFEGKKAGTSAILTNMLGSTALLYTSEDATSKAVGDTVEVLLLD